MGLRRNLLYILFFCFLFIFTSCDELNWVNAEENTESETIVETIQSENEVQTNVDTVEDETSSFPQPGFSLTLDVTELPADATYISVTMTAREVGKSIRWADQWELYRIEGDKKTRVGGIAEESSCEYYSKDNETCLVMENPIFFNDLVRQSTLPTGEYELVYMMNGEPSSEFIRFTVKE